ncbi:MAG: RIP metalloprotease RseP [Rhodospirillaceae bacterium]
MDILNGLWNYAVPFLVVLTILIFVHELGHYLVARMCGVRVEVFSFGMGPELFGRNDRHGTRWRVSLLPLGGYVKMFGDAGAASTPRDDIEEMTPEEKAVSFHHKRLGQRAAIVAAGPIANYIFAVIVLSVLFATYGQPFTPADIGHVQSGSAAEAAGLKVGDVITVIDGRTIERFEEVRSIVSMAAGRSISIEIKRNTVPMILVAVPKSSVVTDRFGNTYTIGLLGISRSGLDYKRHSPEMAVWQALRETYDLTASTLTGVGQMLAGVRGTEDLGGPLRIAQMSGEIAQTGLVSLIWFIALLSINLGMINLFPIPLLDGGHLLFYGFEAVAGRPLGERAQEYGFRIGLALVLTMMLFATWNDLVHLRVVEFFKGLIS